MSRPRKPKPVEPTFAELVEGERQRFREFRAANPVRTWIQVPLELTAEEAETAIIEAVVAKIRGRVF